jgi:hypothetical protein
MTTRIAGTHDSDITVTLDSGSHINARGQRPEGEQREPPVRCTDEMDSSRDLNGIACQSRLASKVALEGGAR